MSEPIKVGDLVMVVRGHPCVVELLGGTPWTVTGFQEPKHGGWHCSRCHMDSAGPNVIAALGAPSVTGCKRPVIPITFLKRIPPLSELEGEKRDEEITA